jgi:hypothetical protein
MKIFNTFQLAVKLLCLVPLRIPVMVLLLVFFTQACTDHVPPGEGDEDDPVQLPDVPAGKFYALAENNLLYEIDFSNPTQALDVIKIETQYPDEKIVAIDFRPATGHLYAISSFGEGYLVNVNVNRIVRTTAINPFGTRPTRPYNYKDIDFDPVLDKFRTLMDDQNYRSDPELLDIDFDNGEPLGVKDPNLGAIAFDNNHAGATGTTQYAIDPVNDRLIRYEDRASRQIQVVGGLGVNIKEIAGFDISPRTSKKQAYAITSVLIGDNWELHHVNLYTGKLTRVGNMPGGNKFLSIAIPSPVAYALDKNHNLLVFNPEDQLEKDPKHLIISKPVTGIPQDVKLLSIDFSVSVRPRIYALGDNSKIYEINHTTGQAKYYTTLSMPFDLTNNPAFGIDFDPYNNNLRVVNSTKHGFNVDLNGGIVSNFGALTFNGDPVGLDAGAFDNSLVGLKNPGDTHFFAISSENKALYKKATGSQELSKVGDLTIQFDKFNGFDIGGKYDRGYGLFKVAGSTGLYEINLTTAEVRRRISTLPYDVIGFTIGNYLYNTEGN